MNSPDSARHRRGRVYTTLRRPGLLLLALLGSTLAGATSTPAQVDITVDPMMTKGARAAPVTIVEFSDYQ